MGAAEELRWLRKAAKVAEHITRGLSYDDLSTYIDGAPNGAVMPVHATGRQWRDLITALAFARNAAAKAGSAPPRDGAGAEE